ncbi:acyl carrier protein [Uliginosibacterium sp. H1]|uniref:acyl carrier protein n=1 Tax=Uliginosibacterium sp. H1 TaxID=3114757 RepID=UPI002E193D1E|nr:phosphopantetheine-binding protein [Uliginosibacterium sp. H1]
MDIRKETAAVLDAVLNLGTRAASLTDDSPLLGSIPELDSMAVVAVITSLEEHFGFEVSDDDIDGSTFQTFGSLVGFVTSKLG